MSGPRPPTRITLGMLIVLVGLFGVGFGLTRSGSTLAATVMSAFTDLVLAVATVGAVVHPRPAAWRGFALFGWLAMILALATIAVNMTWSMGAPANLVVLAPLLATNDMIGEVANRIHPDVASSHLYTNTTIILHHELTLLLGVVGAMLGGWLGKPRACEASPDPGTTSLV